MSRERAAQNLNDTAAERDNRCRANTAEFVGINGEGCVVKEQRHESADDKNRAVENDQSENRE